VVGGLSIGDEVAQLQVLNERGSAVRGGELYAGLPFVESAEFKTAHCAALLPLLEQLVDLALDAAEYAEVGCHEDDHERHQNDSADEFFHEQTSLVPDSGPHLFDDFVPVHGSASTGEVKN
jgi:hypothetical protein